MQRDLNAEDHAELLRLNEQVDRVIRERRDWLDSKMSEYAEVPVGDGIYNTETGTRLGTVTRLYRFWRDRDDGIRDRHLSIDYEYAIGVNVLDNTSRHPTWAFGSREWAIKRAEIRAAELKRQHGR